MEKKAYLKIIAAASLWGCIGIFLKLLNAAGFSSMENVAARSTVAVVLFGLFLAVTDPAKLKINPKHLYYFFGTGVCAQLFFNWCYFNAISTSSMSVAAVLLYTSPVFVIFMSAAFFKENITPIKIFALLLTFLGCTLVTGLLPLGQQSVSVTTILYGLGAGFGYGLYSILSKFALAKYESATVTFYTLLITALFALPISGVYHDLGRFADWRAIVGMLGLGVLCCILPSFLYTSGLQYAEAGKAAIMATIEPFVAAVIGICFFREEVTSFKLLGMAAIFVAILMLNRPAKRAVH